MPTTSGFGVQVMPSIQFADGAQLAGRGPGEAIAGFNSGIGLVNAIQNTRQKAILAPIEQEAARARLAQIQAETELAQAQAPYRAALARIETAKASQPFRTKQGESIVQVPRLDANGQPTGQFDQVIQESGVQYDPVTGTNSPYTANMKPLVTAETAALNNSLIGSRQSTAEYQQDQAAARAEANRIAALNAQTNQDRAKAQADLYAQRINHYKALEAQGKVQIFQTVDANGNLVLNPVDVKTRQALPPISLNAKPNRSVDPLASMMSGDGKVGAVKPKSESMATAATNWVKNKINSFTSPSPAADQPVTTLPVIPAGPVGQASANPAPPDIPDDSEIDNLLGFNPTPVAQPNAAPASPYKIRVVKP